MAEFHAGHGTYGYVARRTFPELHDDPISDLCLYSLYVKEIETMQHWMSCMCAILISTDSNQQEDC